MNGGAAVPRLKMDAPNRSALFATEPDSSQRWPQGRAVSRKLSRCFQTDPRCCHAAPAPPRARIAPVGWRPGVSPLFGVVALRRNQRSSDVRRQLFAKPASFDLPFSPARWQFRFGLAAGLSAGRRRFSPIKFFLTKNPLPTGDRLDRTRLWAPSLPVISPCVQLVALDFPGEQPTLGTSKIMVYRLHLYSLTNQGRCLI
jgi:hypothetical protein